MCGILAILNQNAISHEDIIHLQRLIAERGPDFQSPLISCPLQCGLELRVAAAILHLRGDKLREQPVINDRDNILLFNGQIYEYDHHAIQDGISDTTFLEEQLNICKTKDEVAETLSKIDGPFAFIYWNSDLNSLFYGRDFFGRKSLCQLKDSEGSIPIVISSVGKRQNRCENNHTETWMEVDCSGIHCLEINRCSRTPKYTKFLWNIDAIYKPTARCQDSIQEERTEYRVSKVALLSPLNDDLRSHSAFTNEDMATAIAGFDEKLIESIRKRIKYNRKTCLRCRKEGVEICTHSKVSVAFSGGIDSTMIALALDKILDQHETIDLLTVAFKHESPDRISVGHAFRELRRLCPNRNWRLVLSDITKSELQLQRNNVIGHLIAPCNTVLDDSLGCGCWFISRGRGRMLDSSMNNEAFEKIFDEFLAFKPEEDDSKLYTSPATIFFAGMSIDEQLGGYSSHRAAWSKGGTVAVFEEISMLMRRLSSRNLGRDDRCCSHHGRDVKFPYLDYDLVSYLNELPIGLKMNLDESIEIGPKKLLRTLAIKWGLVETARRTKRALQFGTRIANLEGTKERAADICSRLT